MRRYKQTCTMSGRSSVLKMLDEVQENRKIGKFPPPYRSDLTPYPNADYSDKTREACAVSGDLLAILKICKVIVLGDVCVGKTCIVNRFCHHVFDSNYKATIGVDFEVEKFEILSMPFNLQIWDTAGQERFKSIAQSYYRSAHAVMIVFDVTHTSTLAHCKNWMREALEASRCKPLKFLIATKKDLLPPATYQAVESHAIKMADALEAEYWPVSSKTGENIEKLFFRIAALVFDELISEEQDVRPRNIISSDLISTRNSRMRHRESKNCATLKCKV